MARKKQTVQVDNAASIAAQQAQTAAVQAQTRALHDQAESFKRAQEAQLASSTLANNMKADLTNENLGTVVAGGTAQGNDSAQAATGLRKRRGGSLSSQLGVNV